MQHSCSSVLLPFGTVDTAMGCRIYGRHEGNASHAVKTEPYEVNLFHLRSQ